MALRSIPYCRFCDSQMTTFYQRKNMNIDITEGEVYVIEEHKGQICVLETYKEHESGGLDGKNIYPEYILS